MIDLCNLILPTYYIACQHVKLFGLTSVVKSKLTHTLTKVRAKFSQSVKLYIKFCKFEVLLENCLQTLRTFLDNCL